MLFGTIAPFVTIALFGTIAAFLHPGGGNLSDQGTIATEARQQILEQPGSVARRQNGFGQRIQQRRSSTSRKPAPQPGWVMKAGIKRELGLSDEGQPLSRQRVQVDGRMAVCFGREELVFYPGQFGVQFLN